MDSDVTRKKLVESLGVDQEAITLLGKIYEMQSDEKVKRIQVSLGKKEGLCCKVYLDHQFPTKSSFNAFLQQYRIPCEGISEFRTAYTTTIASTRLEFEKRSLFDYRE